MPTMEEVAKKFDITLEQASQLRNAMSRTWSAIYGDWIDCFEGGESEAYELFENNEAAMVAEATLDADRVTTFCPEEDLGWVYRLEDGSWRSGCVEMGEAVWEAR
jgi:hypothetical protein